MRQKARDWQPLGYGIAFRGSSRMRRMVQLGRFDFCPWPAAGHGARRSAGSARLLALFCAASRRACRASPMWPAPPADASAAYDTRPPRRAAPWSGGARAPNRPGKRAFGDPALLPHIPIAGTAPPPAHSAEPRRCRASGLDTAPAPFLPASATSGDAPLAPARDPRPHAMPRRLRRTRAAVPRRVGGRPAL